MVPRIGIIENLKMYKISRKVINFITEAMKNWQVKFTAEEKTIAKVKIQ